MLSEGKTPEDMLDIVLEGLQPRILDKIDVKFECECCKDKVQEALVAIGKNCIISNNRRRQTSRGRMSIL